MDADEARVRANEQRIDDKIARNERGQFTPWDIVCGMEEKVYDVRDFAQALCIMCEGLDRPASAAVSRIARSIEELAEAIQADREKLCAALYPSSGERTC